MSDRVAKATISDAELLEALEAAEDEHGSMANAVRHAIESTYGDDEGELTRLMRAHMELIDTFGAGSRIGLETAESTLAQSMQIPKDEVRSTLLTPMTAEGWIAIHQGLYDVTVIIGEEVDR